MSHDRVRNGARGWPARAPALLRGAGLSLLLLWLGHAAGARLFERRAGATLLRAAEAESNGRRARKDEPAVAPPGTPLGRLRVPRLGMDVIVTEGTSDATLAHAAGHIAWTAAPGSRGSVGLAGHRDGLFRPLRSIALGDSIHLETPGGDDIYRVDSLLVVTPDRGDWLRRVRRPTLWLVTCYPFHFLGPAPRRRLVRAPLVSSVPRAGAALPPAPTASHREGAWNAPTN